MNNICIVGRVTKDVEIEETANGIKCAKFNVAVQREYRDKNGERDTDFFSCRAWRNTAEMIAKYFFKGKAIGIIGAMHSRSYVKDGKTQTMWEIDVTNFTFPAVEKSEEPREKGTKYEQELITIDDDNCPF